MRKKFKLLAFVVALSIVNPVATNATEEPWEPPKLVSLEFSPNEIELTKPNPVLTVNLKVSHPIGIKSERVTIYLRNSVYPSSFVYQFSANRTDSPIQSNLKNVTFIGSFQVPTSITPGVWNISTDSVQGLASTRATGWPESGSFTPIIFSQ